MQEFDNYLTSEIETPIGKMIIGATEKGICLLEYADEARVEMHQNRIFKQRKLKPLPGENNHMSELKKQLEDYFNQKLFSFSIPLDLIGSSFQLKVWNELLKVPYGATRTYKHQALTVGDRKSTRAVAGANGKNAISIVVPCHRIIGADGNLTGYGGQLWRKQFLLELESGQSRLF